MCVFVVFVVGVGFESESWVSSTVFFPGRIDENDVEFRAEGGEEVALFEVHFHVHHWGGLGGDGLVFELY